MHGVPRPVLDRPALLLPSLARGDRATLVVADLHLGLGGETPRTGVPPATTAASLAEDLLTIARDEGAHRIVVAGDVKHPIVGTPRPLRPVVFDFFATLLSAGLAADVVLGNHDVGLTESLPREVQVHPPDGLRLGDLGIFHGHRWPSSRVLAAPRLVAGHLHPGVRLAPSPERPTGKERCWVRTSVRSTPTSGRRSRPQVRATEILILPAFNPLAGTEALNRSRPRRGRSFLYRRFLSLGETRAYLLDGTDLGVLPTPGPDPPRARARATARRR